jgi:polar amino acid transport system substrate-binding protein
MRQVMVAWIAVWLCATACAAEHTPARLRICFEDAANAPWQTKGGQGLDYVLVRMAAKISGIAIQPVNLPWKRCLKSMENGAIDGVASVSYTPGRAAYASYPTLPDGSLDIALRIRNDSYSLYRLRGSDVQWDGQTFSNLRGPVGGQLGFSVVQDLAQVGVEVDDSNQDSDSLMRLLVLGRFQMVAILTGQGNALMASAPYAGKVEGLSPVFVGKPYFIPFNTAFYAANYELVRRFWKGLATARKSAAFQAQLKAQMADVATLPP